MKQKKNSLADHDKMWYITRMSLPKLHQLEDMSPSSRLQVIPSTICTPQTLRNFPLFRFQWFI
jgi:hypothetical protein